MPRRAIVLASGNPGKLTELSTLMTSLDCSVRPQSDYGLLSPPETGATFEENALLKAKFASQRTGLAALADDSGLEVDALGGAPGIRSARYAGQDASAAQNVRKLLSKLAELAGDRFPARFRCALAYVDPHSREPAVVATGVWEGHVAPALRGNGGFGYDPLFQVGHLNIAAAQLPTKIKNRISHRSQALARLKKQLTHHFATHA